MAFHLDFETASPVNITKLGGYRYASDPETRILMAAVCEDDSDVVLWDRYDPESRESQEALRLIRRASTSGDLIYAHNAQFELAVCHYLSERTFEVPAPKIDQWRCTAAMCARAAIPTSLSGASEFLKLADSKDKAGKVLINIFSDFTKLVTLYPPSDAPRGTSSRKVVSPIFDEEDIPWTWQITVAGARITVREAWEMFKEYCRQDVRAEREVHKRLHKFELEGDVLESYQFNLRMNHRGIPINRKALETALKISEEFQEKTGKQFQEITGFSPTQRNKIILWLEGQGYTGKNMTAATVEAELSIPLEKSLLTEKGRKVLESYQLLSFAALKKIPAMLNAACPEDDRVRGTMLWHGARTGRATGRVVQPQNMKKATVKTEVAYEMLSHVCTLEDIEELWDSPLEVIASCARHFLQLPNGQAMFDADYSGVEARITPWLAGAKAKLESILAGIGQYEATASQIFNVPYEEVTRLQRSMAKPVELGCCFGVGAKGLKKSLTEAGVSITFEECKRIVKIYRENNAEVVEAWGALEDAVRTAIETGKTTTILDGRLKVGRAITGGVKYFVVQLPSGRRLYYPHPQIKRVFKKYDEEDMIAEPWKRETGGYFADEIRFWGQRPNNAGWGWIATWGSRLLENAVQAIGVDLLDYGVRQAEKAGHEIFMIVHDQTLAPASDLGIDNFIRKFTSKQPWAETFPLDAEGDIVPYYLKED